MPAYKKLPQSEFDVMKAVWNSPAGVTSSTLMEALGSERGWKAPSLISFLKRLEEKGFLRSEKQGKERRYYPLVDREDYLAFETEVFVKEYHSNSLVNLVSSLYAGGKLEDAEIRDLLNWVEKQSQ